MSSKKRGRLENGSKIPWHCKENQVPPGSGWSPPKKRQKHSHTQDVNSSQHPLKGRQTNVAVCKSQTKGTGRIHHVWVDQENREPAQPNLKDHRDVCCETSLCPQRIDSHFPKKYRSDPGPTEPKPTGSVPDREPSPQTAVQPPATCVQVTPEQEVARSVCQIQLDHVFQGTAFVLFDDFIMTNWHVVKEFITRQMLKEHGSLSVTFCEPEPLVFTADESFLFMDEKLDCIVLRIRPTGAQSVEVPPGLLRRFRPPPEKGEGFIIGYQSEEEKTIRAVTFVEKSGRNQPLGDFLAKHEGLILTCESMLQLMRNQALPEFLEGGAKAQNVITYNGGMLHGTSGSPVLDKDGHLIGLHAAGFTFGFPGHRGSLMEFGYKMSLILNSFLSKLLQAGNEHLLLRISEEAAGNPSLKDFLQRQVSPELPHMYFKDIRV